MKRSSLTGGPFSTSDVWRQFVTSLLEEEKSAFIYMQTKLTRAKRLLSRLSGPRKHRGVKGGGTNSISVNVWSVKEHV